MKIYCVTHGETLWALDGRIEGYHFDSDLTDQALAATQALGANLAEIAFDQILTSDQGRARQTAEILNQVNQHSCPILTAPGLREWDLGTFEGWKQDILAAIYPQQWQALTNNLALFDYSSCEAESVPRLLQRFRSVISSLLAENFNQVLLVGHPTCLTLGILDILGFNLTDFKLSAQLAPNSVTILDIGPGQTANLLQWNEQSEQFTDQNELLTQYP